jgi:hypothetical protein
MKLKMYGGRHPQPDEGWIRETTISMDGVDWILYSKLQAHSDCWTTFKLVVVGRVEKKANYWVVKNMQTGQIAYPADMALMKEHRPKLHEKLEMFFVKKMFEATVDA